MANTQEELNEIKEEVETLNKKLQELTEEELAQVSGGGGVITWSGFDCKNCRYTTCPQRGH